MLLRLGLCGPCSLQHHRVEERLLVAVPPLVVLHVAHGFSSNDILRLLRVGPCVVALLCFESAAGSSLIWRILGRELRLGPQPPSWLAWAAAVLTSLVFVALWALSRLTLMWRWVRHKLWCSYYGAGGRFYVAWPTSFTPTGSPGPLDLERAGPAGPARLFQRLRSKLCLGCGLGAASTCRCC